MNARRRRDAVTILMAAAIFLAIAPVLSRCWP